MRAAWTSGQVAAFARAQGFSEALAAVVDDSGIDAEAATSTSEHDLVELLKSLQAPDAQRFVPMLRAALRGELPPSPALVVAAAAAPAVAGPVVAAPSLASPAAAAAPAVASATVVPAPPVALPAAPSTPPAVVSSDPRLVQLSVSQARSLLLQVAPVLHADKLPAWTGRALAEACCTAPGGEDAAERQLMASLGVIKTVAKKVRMHVAARVQAEGGIPPEAPLDPALAALEARLMARIDAMEERLMRLLVVQQSTK